ncbi:UNVERIFIED_CONTAM: hypothetical protein PYX00_003244 [Menopon gallinae]|uniref:Transmembrane protein 267 n=1 Tax=Menopon gallinae TaxID=328185 RepID=A0AAW2HZJ5_9NEOP
MQLALSKNKVASSVAILLACLVGDKNSVPLKEGDLAAAVCDNITHAIVGVFVWLSVILGRSPIGPTNYIEIVTCGLISSFIDLDHFMAARSFNLKDAVNLSHRPMFHCTSGAMAVSGGMLMIAYLLHISWLYRFACIVIAAFLSHHIRDSTRRGLWIWPFGVTKPIPYFAYLIAEVLLPHAIIMLVSAFPVESPRNYDSNV